MKKIISLLLLPLLAFAIEPQTRELEKEKPSIGKPKIEKPKFPEHWGKPPEVQTKDFVKLPGKFGMGSSTLAEWIKENIKNDKKNADNQEVAKPNTEEIKKPTIPTRPQVEIPVEIKSAIETHKSVESQLKNEFANKVKELGESPSREEVRKLAETFRTENASVIDSQKELGKKIHEYFKANKPERPSRQEPSTEIKQKLNNVLEKRKILDDAKQDLLNKLKEAKELTKEEKQKLLEEFKEQNAEKHLELKNAEKELQEKIREIKQTGERRQ